MAKGKKNKKSQSQIINVHLDPTEGQDDEELLSGWRERKMSEVPAKLKHPDPIPGYKSTLPGAPGWQYKIDPGA